MDPLTISQIALALGTVAWQATKNAGVLGSPDWVKYVDAGLLVSQKALQIIEEIKAGSVDYDNLTPDQIRTLLAPAGWDELEARALVELTVDPPPAV